MMETNMGTNAEKSVESNKELNMFRKDEQLAGERFVLLIYLIYSIMMTVISLESGWPVWMAFVFAMSYVVSMAVHLAQFRDYRFRAFFTASLMQCCVIFWSASGASLSMIVSALSALAVMVGMYSIPEILYITFGATCFLNFYYIFVLKVLETYNNMVGQLVLEIAAVYFVEVVMYTLVKKRMEASGKQKAVIESLKEVEHSKDDFLANISHEIRTPINTICGMSEIVLREDLPDQVRDDLFNIQTAGRNLLSIVSDVLDFSELQAGNMLLFEESYNITSTINDIINMSMARKSERHIELIVDCNADIPCGMAGDEQKIRRVIMNLVDNALKFTVEGCVSIVISTRETEYGVNLIVKVKDTGIGMKKDSLEKLFTSFNQVDTKRNRQEGGIGLGLAISQAIIEKMGGFITIQSEYGKGSQVQFVIPQKVVDNTPIVVVREPERINIAVYVDMEQFERRGIRDEYDHLISHLTGQLKIKSHACQNLAELKRRMQREAFTHIFISILEYEEDPEFFDAVARSVIVVALIDRTEGDRLKSKHIRRLYKPLFIIPIAMLLNDEELVQGIDEHSHYQGRFTAPETTVLAVDDNLMNIRVLEGLLRPYKIKFSMAMSGAEALEKIDSMAYDLIFMDHMMPEMDGIETMHRIRQKSGNYFRKIPIVALTANAIGGMREVFLKEGFQDFMAKPIEVSVLERVLRRNLPQEKLLHASAAEYTVSDAASDALEGQSGGQPGQEAGNALNIKSVNIEHIKIEDIKIEDIENEIKAVEKKAGKQEPAAPRFTDLPPDSFDEQMGIRYCGDLENYIEILQLSSNGGEETKSKIVKSFEGRDWKNYTVYVHGLKSSMMTIGVEHLSGMAKELEAAGKRTDEAFILEHHDAMIQEYSRILSIMKASRTVCPDAGLQEETACDELEDAEFERLAAEFEDAAFAFDAERMEEIADRLAASSYQGRALKEQMEPVLRKIAMSDYLSASDIISAIKK